MFTVPPPASKALIDKARLALRQGLFDDAWACLEQIPATSDEAAIVELWKLRILAERGMIGQAVDLAQRNLREPQLATDAVLDLWSRFTLLLAKSDRVSEADVNSGVMAHPYF